jgi:hypothetical protein
MDLQGGARRFSWGVFWGPFWAVVSLVAGLACWIVGDGHGIGVNPPIPENAKLAVVLLGWLFIIDGVRMLRGHQSFMRYVYRYGFYLALGGLAILLVMWIYEALSLKALVALGLIAAIAPSCLSCESYESGAPERTPTWLSEASRKTSKAMEHGIEIGRGGNLAGS